MFYYGKGREPLAQTSTSTSFCRSSGKKTNKQTKTKPSGRIGHRLHTQGKIEIITNIDPSISGKQQIVLQDSHCQTSMVNHRKSTNHQSEDMTTCYQYQTTTCPL